HDVCQIENLRLTTGQAWQPCADALRSASSTETAHSGVHSAQTRTFASRKAGVDPTAVCQCEMRWWPFFRVNLPHCRGPAQETVSRVPYVSQALSIPPPTYDRSLTDLPPDREDLWDTWDTGVKSLRGRPVLRTKFANSGATGEIQAATRRGVRA